MTIKVGRNHKWSADVRGEPPPTITWIWRDNIPLSDSERIKVTNVDYHTEFSILKCLRKDAGKYKVIAENRNGRDEVQVELIVLGSSESFPRFFSVFEGL